MKQTTKVILTLLTLLTFGFIASLPAETPSPEMINLWPEGKAPDGDGNFENTNATITVFHPEKPNGTAIVICPGGGYGQVVRAEGAPIAKWLNTQGITGIVLNYRLPKGDPHRPLSDVQEALRLTKSKTAEWHLNPKRIGVMGFSAGGHLAAMAATKFTPEGANRPDFAILVYPVITMGEGTHGGSRKNLLGPNPTAEQIQLYSNELQVTPQTPPTFLAHAADDKVVPPRNSEKFRDALFAKKIPAKYLALPNGGHGLNGYKGPMWDAWQTQSIQWLIGLNVKSD